MPITVHWEEDGAVFEIHGELTFSDYRQALSLVWGQPNYDKMHYLIEDVREQALGSDFSPLEVETLVFFAAGLFKERQFIVAVVVNPENLASIAANECYHRNAVHPHAIFTNLDDARNWIRDQMEKA